MEWTSTRYDAASEERYFRGGSWVFDRESIFRVDARAAYGPAVRDIGLGMRCAR
jgi:formylglycine-generating enzyme required for sulfatase activity